jgi:hypothetical protein
VGGARAVRGPRAAWACVAGACIVSGASAVGACQKDPVVTTRSVTLHAPQACAPGLASLSADAGAFAVYHALGDYEPAPPVDGHLVDTGTLLPEIDPAARALLVDTTEQDREWQGVSPIAPTGGVDVLLLPAITPCALRGTVGATGATIGIAGQQALIVSGSSDRAPGTAVFRLDTGAVDALPASPASVRTGSTVTAFGAAALVAGGISASGVLGEADVYDPAAGGFVSPSIALSAPRYAAGAAVLATGETLLVGGIGEDRMTALDSIEIVDPVTRKARPAPSRLAFARSGPTVLHLASGEIFVAGGVDSNEAAVTKLEWFSSDLSQAITSRTEDLVAGSARAYAALEGGGVLAVVAPPPNAPANFQNVWVIDPDGVPEPATPIDGPTPQPVLFGGAGGAPVLWTGAAAGVPGRWLRWQPWVGAFAALEVLDDTPGRMMGPSSASPDPGTALWLDTTTATARLAALRFDVRGEYSTLSGPLLVSDTTDVVPDRLPADGVLSFDPGAGHLTLDPGTTAPGASAFVSDRTYADVRIEVDAPTGQPALVVLRDALGDEMEVGGAACAGTVVTGAASTLTVERNGANITWTIADGASGKCTLGFDADARVSVGVRAAPDLVQSVVTNLRVTRLGTP